MRYLLPLLLLLSGCGCMSVPSHDELRATALRLEFQDGVCSGTAIGPDSLLTAVHCLTHPLLRVNGQSVTVTASRTESRDRIVVKVSGIRFKAWAKRGPMPLQGDTLRFWGVPQASRTCTAKSSYRAPGRISLCCRALSAPVTQVPDWWTHKAASWAWCPR